MTNHPNRTKNHPSRNPRPDEVLAARKAAGLTQTEAARVIHSGMRAWQEWEAGNTRMHPAFWELFRLKAAQLPVKIAPASVETAPAVEEGH
jgi:DNA-binding transcriptional regulator YiaG